MRAIRDTRAALTAALVAAVLLAQGQLAARASGPRQPGIPRVPLCDEAPAVPVCEIAYAWDVDALNDALAVQNPLLWQVEDVLYVVYRGAFDNVILYGGIISEMTPIPGAKAWGLALRVQGLDHALITIGFVPLVDDMTVSAGVEPRIFHGEHAPDMPQVDTLAGTLQTYQLNSAYLTHPRRATVYLPPGYDPAQRYLTVYMVDGQDLSAHVPYLEAQILAGNLPPLVVVGVHAAGLEDATSARDIPREAEYLIERGDARFFAHETFVIDEVIPWAEATFGASPDRSERVLYGFSNGANVAITLALRHPDLFGTVLPFSVGGWRPALPDGFVVQYPARWFFVAGTLEEDFNVITRDWVALLGAEYGADTGSAVEFRETVAGHDGIQWHVYFPVALVELFGSE